MCKLKYIVTDIGSHVETDLVRLDHCTQIRRDLGFVAEIVRVMLSAAGIAPELDPIYDEWNTASATGPTQKGLVGRTHLANQRRVAAQEL